jgi:hypothetical protein
VLLMVQIFSGEFSAPQDAAIPHHSVELSILPCNEQSLCGHNNLSSYECLTAMSFG